MTLWGVAEMSESFTIKCVSCHIRQSYTWWGRPPAGAWQGRADPGRLTVGSASFDPLAMAWSSRTDQTHHPGRRKGHWNNLFQSWILRDLRIKSIFLRRKIMVPGKLCNIFLWEGHFSCLQRQVQFTGKWLASFLLLFLWQAICFFLLLLMFYSIAIATRNKKALRKPAHM